MSAVPNDESDTVLAAAPAAAPLAERPVVLALLSHTRAAQRGLAQMLGAADASARPGAIPAQAEPLIESPAGDRLLLWRTPGLGEPRRLTRQLAQAGQPLGRWLSPLWQRWREPTLWPARQRLLQALAEADVLLYVVNAAEPPLEADYLDAELQVLRLHQRPVVVVLSQLALADPADDHARTEHLLAWYTRLRHVGPVVKAVLPMDAFHRCWVHENVLWQAVADQLRPSQQSAFERLRRAWLERAQATWRAAVDELARRITSAAMDRQALPLALPGPVASEAFAAAASAGPSTGRASSLSPGTAGGMPPPPQAAGSTPRADAGASSPAGAGDPDGLPGAPRARPGDGGRRSGLQPIGRLLGMAAAPHAANDTLPPDPPGAPPPHWRAGVQLAQRLAIDLHRSTRMLAALHGLDRDTADELAARLTRLHGDATRGDASAPAGATRPGSQGPQAAPGSPPDPGAAGTPRDMPGTTSANTSGDGAANTVANIPGGTGADRHADPHADPHTDIPATAGHRPTNRSDTAPGRAAAAARSQGDADRGAAVRRARDTQPDSSPGSSPDTGQDGPQDHRQDRRPAADRAGEQARHRARDRADDASAAVRARGVASGPLADPLAPLGRAQREALQGAGLLPLLRPVARWRRAAGSAAAGRVPSAASEPSWDQPTQPAGSEPPDGQGVPAWQRLPGTDPSLLAWSPAALDALIANALLTYLAAVHQGRGRSAWLAPQPPQAWTRAIGRVVAERQPAIDRLWQHRATFIGLPPHDPARAAGGAALSAALGLLLQDACATVLAQLYPQAEGLLPV